ncbi:heparan-alpha-glucosaminide N-acetyltransferase domain-containing protein [Nonlabens tegetincola]|uniref:heparan-alpha-glucosaminide N-acetyltransferase domain-containing protein n=1 Tax=Nonlabens tegetincola TaxID=323273 RepID=UPI000CF51D13|nr:heparan-alpha-glucosaminide N-acetyltransferase domain-containing protein [Nonlabens tegetincola]PQJ19077.1 hypothetical protein BST93_04705 [Nonlabens tegetincola]
MNPKRIFFIDAVRAFAILMMLQGHFISTLLAPEFHVQGNFFYEIWNYFRGITAPTFFTISGLIFSFLLLKSKKQGIANERIKKGFYRGLLLIGIGYSLRISLFTWLDGRLGTNFLRVDVLQCIGLSLIITVGCYYLVLKNSLVFSLIQFILGVSIFLLEPYYRELDTSQLPVFIANYLSKNNGSIFTILPWLGYMSIGSFIASIFYKYHLKEKFKSVLIIGFFVVGILLIYHSSWFLMILYRTTDIELFKSVAYYNYLITRLGNVFILFGTFYALERFFKDSKLLIIGQKTLSIYVIHFIIIYGSFTGFGLHQLIGKTLNPYTAIIGAFTFILIVCALALYGARTNKFLYSRAREYFKTES